MSTPTATPMAPPQNRNAKILFFPYEKSRPSGELGFLMPDEPVKIVSNRRRIQELLTEIKRRLQPGPRRVS